MTAAAERGLTQAVPTAITTMKPVKLSAELIEAFAGTFLSPLYDEAKPTPQFHRECWALYCSDVQSAAIAAPRSHAKSTALTHDFGLAVALFRIQKYIVILGASEEMAQEHLGDIATELRENDDLIREFRISRFVSDQKTDIIVECEDGYQFRFLARGGEQKIRGKKWQGKRPGMIICDDLEDDEQVESKERRMKFSRWFLRAAKQALRDGGQIRVHGTILHEDSLLANLMKNPTWKTKLYKAHAGFDDFTGILWPERFPESRLRAIRKELMDNGDAGGYSQEYLNDPLDNSDAFIRMSDFIPMNDEDHDVDKKICAAADFAVSKADLANRTSFTVGGKDVRNLLHFLDYRVGRWDPKEWIDEMFLIQTRWNPEVFFVEGGVIWNAVEKTIHEDMRRRDQWINLAVVNPVKDKATRGTPFKKRMRAGGCRWNTRHEGYESARDEILRFTGISQARLDDQFDSAALLSKGFEEIPLLDQEDFVSEEEMEMVHNDPRRDEGRSSVTGY